MKVGFIGTGSMGSPPIYALIQSGSIRAPADRREQPNPSKVRQLSLRHPGLHESA